MREKIFKVCNAVYGVLMTASFFGGVLPLIPYIVALICGGGEGGIGESIANFLYNDYYPWVILAGSVAVIFGLIAMYVGKLEGLSIKKVSVDENAKEDK